MTDRDIAILRMAARFRFVSSDQVVRFFGMSHQQILRRLKLLYFHSFLDRPKHQQVHLAAFYDQGNRPLVYGLGREGARLLSELGDPVDSRLDWTTKNARAGALFFAHTLGVTEVMLGFARACRAPGGPQLIDHHELLPYLPADTRVMKDPFRLRISVYGERGGPHTIPIIPDRLFSLAHSDNTRGNFALELDTGSMPVKAKHLERSSIKRKHLGYFVAWREGFYRDQWDFQSFRVLVVAPSDKRIQNMMAVQREVTKDSASGLFLYSTPERLALSGPLGPAWLSARNETVSLSQQK